MFLVGAPLLMLSFAVYNILVFLMPGFSWTREVFRFPTLTEADWGLTAGDIIVAASILLLLVEIIKTARVARRGVVDHTLSLLLFGGMVAEFLLVKEVVTTTFFLLLVISFVDVFGGFAIASGVARRREELIAFERVHPE
jgi:hypothetical protein